MRCVGNAKTLHVIDPPYTAVNLCTTVGQSRIYVRPLQSNIVLSAQPRRYVIYYVIYVQVTSFYLPTPFTCAFVKY